MRFVISYFRMGGVDVDLSNEIYRIVIAFCPNELRR